jgi:hypothetical protein
MAIKKEVEIVVKTDESVKDIDKLTKAVDNLDEEIQQTSGDASKGIEEIGDASKKSRKGIKGLSQGFKILGASIKATGIGLLISALASLGSALGENQKVMDLFSTATKTASIVIQDLFSFVTKNGGQVVKFFKDIFENPLESIKDFGNAIQENLIERFNSYLDTLGFIADGVKNLFKGDFDEAIESFKSAGKEAVDVLTGVDGSFDKISDTITNTTNAIVDYTKETLASAQASVEASKSIERLRLEQDRLNEQYDREAELQRQIRDDVSKSIEERIEANKRLGEILTEQTEKQDQNALNRIALLQQEQAELGFTEERSNAIFELETERLAIQAKISGIRSEQLVNENSLLLEQQDLIAQQKEEEKESAEAKEEAQKKTDANDKKRKQDELKREQILSKQKVDLTNSTLGAIQNILGENNKISKAFGVAQATMNAYLGVSEVWKSKSETGLVGAGFLQKLVTSGLTLAQGFGAVKAISKTNPSISAGSPSLSGGGGSAISSQAQAIAQSPQFNVVGASGQSQLAQSLADQQQAPVKAFVVATDVTTQQQLDRQKVETSSFG